MNGRDKNGRFVKGNTGGGRKAMPKAMKEMAVEYAPQALQYAYQVMTDDAEKTAYRLDAAKLIIDRAYGKPAQDINAALTTGENFTLVITGDQEHAE